MDRSSITRVVITGIGLVIIGSAFLRSCGGPSSSMNFFVTSVPPGDGGNLGGLAQADAHCQKLAQAVGSRRQRWHAYLSAAGVNARDRIGSGPWFNAKGVQIAATVADLHGPHNQLGGRTSLTEKGEVILAHRHDILTGSNEDGTLAAGNSTCQNWTSTSGQAMVGHSNKVGNYGERVDSWNSAHLSDGCSVAALKKRGGAGLVYCFAAD